VIVFFLIAFKGCNFLSDQITTHMMIYGCTY